MPSCPAPFRYLNRRLVSPTQAEVDQVLCATLALLEPEERTEDTRCKLLNRATALSRHSICSLSDMLDRLRKLLAEGIPLNKVLTMWPPAWSKAGVPKEVTDPAE